MKKHTPWYLVLLCMILVGLAGQRAALAEPCDLPEPPGFALGFHGPDEPAGQVDFAPEGDPASPLSTPDGSCDWAITYEEQVLCLINQQRLAYGLYPYRNNAVLDTAAEAHSAYMRDQGCFDHQCAGEASPAQRACSAGYQPYCWGECYIGETIAAGYPSPASVVSAWLDSPGHRDLILHQKLREIGVGYVNGGSYHHYWTVDYGSQPNTLPVFVNGDARVAADPVVTLTLTNEEVSGCSGIDYADQVMLSNDPGFAGASWEAYSLHKTWQLPDENGPKTIYVKFQDAAGLQVVSTDEIVLDAPARYDLDVSSHLVTFVYEIGAGFGTSPSSRPVGVSNADGSTPMTWCAECSGGSGWLELAPTGGTTPDSILISVEGFATTMPGTYQATVTLTSTEDPDNPEQVTVTVIAVEQIHRVMLPVVARNDP